MLPPVFFSDSEDYMSAKIFCKPTAKSMCVIHCAMQKLRKCGSRSDDIYDIQIYENLNQHNLHIENDFLSVSFCCFFTVKVYCLLALHFIVDQFKTGTSNLSTTYLPTNPASVGVGVYNPTSTHYTASLAHHHHQYGTTNKPNIMGTTMNSLTHHPISITGNLGPAGILGKYQFICCQRNSLIQVLH